MSSDECGNARCYEVLGRNVRRQLSLQKCDLVFQVELALLQALELELILDGV